MSQGWATSRWGRSQASRPRAFRPEVVGLEARALLSTLSSNTFSAPVGAEWSNPKESTTPSGQSFLGEFVNNAVRLTLTDPHPHTTATVAIDLYILRTWTGYKPNSDC